MITYFRYGLQAAINFISVLILTPLILWSHITSLIKPKDSVVLASSKKITVSSPKALLHAATLSAFFINLIMVSSVVPP